jgi:hypothetical protein
MAWEIAKMVLNSVSAWEKDSYDKLFPQLQVAQKLSDPKRQRRQRRVRKWPEDALWLDNLQNHVLEIVVRLLNGGGSASVVANIP